MGAPRIDRLDRNYLINGNFDFWQRSTSFANTGSNSTYGSADRWYNWSGIPGHNVTFSRVAGEKAQWAMRVQRNAGNTVASNAQIAQTVEISFGRDLGGRNIALVFRARRGANYSPAGNILVSSIDHGTGSVDQNIITTGHVGQVTTEQNNVLTTNYQDFIQFVTVPSGRTQFSVRFRMDTIGTAGANDWFEIEQVGLIISSIQPLEFRRAGRTYAEEFQLCERYYEKSYNTETVPGSTVNLPGFTFFRSFANVQTTVYYKTKKRVTAAVTFYDPQTGTAGQARNYTTASGFAISVNLGGDGSFSANGSSTADSGVGFHWVADAEI
jgi:hypothetical protein